VLAAGTEMGHTTGYLYLQVVEHWSCKNLKSCPHVNIIVKYLFEGLAMEGYFLTSNYWNERAGPIIWQEHLCSSASVTFAVIAV